MIFHSPAERAPHAGKTRRAPDRSVATETVFVLKSGEGRNRTGDTTVFSRVLYQLSYLAKAGEV
jgi:hypothetical protein